MTPEGDVKKQVKLLLERYVPHGLWYFMPVSCGYGKHGIPDFIICFVGQFIVVETKADKYGHPKPLQKVQLDLLQKAGALALVINKTTNLDVLEVQLNTLLTELVHATATHKPD